MMQRTVLSLTLPFPPGVNNLFANVPGKGRRTSERYRIWAVAAGNELLAQLAGMSKPVFSGPVSMEIRLGRPDKRRRDIDGLAKAVMDRLTGIAYLDDSQVVDLRLRWADVEGAHVTMVAA